MRTLTNKLTTLFVLAAIFALSLFIFSPRSYAADCSGGNLSTKAAIQCGTNGASGNNQTPDNAVSNLNNTVSSVVNVLTVVVGVVAVIMIIIAGFRYVASGGKQESVQSAKNTILYAVIGLVIVALAQIIVHFVLYRTGVATQPSP